MGKSPIARFSWKISLGVCLGTLIIGLTDCKKRNLDQYSGGNPTSQNKNTGVKKVDFGYGQPVILRNSDYIIIPVESREKAERIGFGFSSSSLEKDTNLINLVHYNKKTGIYRILFERRLKIKLVVYPESFGMPVPLDSNRQNDAQDIRATRTSTGGISRILLVAQEKDTNDDGEVDREDADQVYLIAPDGAYPHRVNPDNTRYLGWKNDPDAQDIYLYLRFDYDKNKTFDDSDSVRILRVNLEKPGTGQLLIPKRVTARLEEILNRPTLKKNLKKTQDSPAPPPRSAARRKSRACSRCGVWG